VYSTNHTTLSPTEDPFWDFSFDEMARYDLPAMIEFVVQMTSMQQLSYVGHSQGTLEAFIAFSQNETLASHISIFSAMAPIAYLGNIKGVLKEFAVPGYVIYATYGLKEFPKNISKSHVAWGTTCSDDIELCTNLFCSIYGCDPENWNKTRYGVFSSHNPAGTSVKNMVHFTQGVRSDLYQAFDYGTVGNLDHYHSKTPPQYNLSQVAVKRIALFSGGRDYLADPTDVARMITLLPPQSLILSNVQANYSHNDFTVGLNAYELIYSKIVNLSLQFSESYL